MYLRKDNLIAAAALLGFDHLNGIDYPDSENYHEGYFEVLEEELKESEITTIEESGSIVISDLGQFYICMLAMPDIFVQIRNEISEIMRTVYIKGYYYVYLDEKNDVINLDQIMTLELVAGAIAQAIEGAGDSEKAVSIEAVSDISTLSVSFLDNGEAMKLEDGESEIREYSETDCVNDIMAWILKELKKRDEYA